MAWDIVLMLANIVNKLIFSSLIGRIVALNLTALCFLLAGIIYIDNIHSNLVKNKFSAMNTQAQIISEIVGKLSKNNSSTAIIDLLVELAQHNKLQIRIYNKSGQIIIDTEQYHRNVSFNSQAIDKHILQTVLAGSVVSWEEKDKKAGKLLNTAVSLVRNNKIIGCLQITNLDKEIDKIVHKLNIKILSFALFISTIFGLLSLYLAYSIAAPLRRLSIAAKKASSFKNPPTTIPQFVRRYDEIEILANSMQRMMQAFYAHLEIMESFAQDVSHELKNPLASLASALETMPNSNAEQQKLLQNIMKSDIDRMNLLISDIADASRIDAELARGSYSYVDIFQILQKQIKRAQNIVKDKNIKFEFSQKCSSKAIIQGHELRLTQLFENLISNAVSFAPAQNGIIKIKLTANAREILVLIEDNGPGIKAKNIDDIFKRFYTQRNSEAEFGINSGLGLAIAKQIVEAHKGLLKAENIIASSNKVEGARFKVILPKF